MSEPYGIHLPTILTGIICIGVLAGVWYVYANRDWDAERRARNFYKSYANTFEDDDDKQATETTKRLVRLTVAHCRVRLGLLSNSTANRKVVSEVVRAYMIERGVRPTHISRHFPKAVEAYFLANDDDIELSSLRRTRALRGLTRGAGDSL
jgi:hypothetical protein